MDYINLGKLIYSYIIMMNDTENRSISFLIQWLRKRQRNQVERFLGGKSQIGELDLDDFYKDDVSRIYEIPVKYKDEDNEDLDVGFELWEAIVPQKGDILLVNDPIERKHFLCECMKLILISRLSNSIIGMDI